MDKAEEEAINAAKAAAFKYEVLSNGHAEFVSFFVCSPVGIRYILFLFPY